MHLVSASLYDRKRAMHIKGAGMKFFSRKMIIIIVALIAVVSIFYFFQLGKFFTLGKIQEHHVFLKQFVHENYILSVLIYIGIYSLLLACALPIVMPLAFIGGFLYGILLGIVYATLSCLIGSIISYTVLRFVVVHWIADWHNERIERFNQQIQKYGYSYLLILHFLSIIPLFVINLLAAVANVPLKTIIWVTILGTLPLNVLCVFAGQQISTVHSFRDIFSPFMIILLILLVGVALVPIFIKKIRGKFGI